MGESGAGVARCGAREEDEEEEALDGFWAKGMFTRMEGRSEEPGGEDGVGRAEAAYGWVLVSEL